MSDETKEPILTTLCPDCGGGGQKHEGWDYDKTPIEEIIMICETCGGDGQVEVNNA